MKKKQRFHSSTRRLESLRQPLEDGAVTVARVNATLTFPSRIILVVAMNEVTSITIQYGDKQVAI